MKTAVQTETTWELLALVSWIGHNGFFCIKTCGIEVFFASTDYAWGSSEEHKIDLVNGTKPNEGRVELRMDRSSKWQGVCDKNFSMKEAQVVCRTMGYSGAKAFYTGSRFGSNLNGIGLGPINCTGEETSLDQCRWDEVINCIDGHWASVECYGKKIY